MSTWASRVSPRPSWLGRDCFQYVSWLEHVLSHFIISVQVPIPYFELRWQTDFSCESHHLPKLPGLVSCADLDISPPAWACWCTSCADLLHASARCRADGRWSYRANPCRPGSA